MSTITSLQPLFILTEAELFKLAIALVKEGFKSSSKGNNGEIDTESDTKRHMMLMAGARDVLRAKGLIK